MEDETKSLISLIALLLSSLGYSYVSATYMTKGLARVLFLLLTFYLLAIFPWYFTSSLVRGVLSFFITWIASFKLLLFCFHKGPLLASRNFLDFVAVAIFPLKIQENTHPSSPIMVARYELVTLFNKPYLATSLQDFWGRRWNRLSSNILRQTIYDPTQNVLVGFVGAGKARVLAMVTTLVISGVTWFFVLQGISMAFEGALKYLARVKGWTPVHPTVSNVLTLAFVSSTFSWFLVLPVWRSGRNDCGFRPKILPFREYIDHSKSFQLLSELQYNLS
ncbi:long-chain-alcohol O-fatty-acyltransferase [Salix suchowensis]|nr:long-chain-alcohol O-fatty-acyltransferase [Salix suchowensis]